MKGEITMEDNVKINDKMEDIRRILEERNYRYVYNYEGDFFMMPAVLENELTRQMSFLVCSRKGVAFIFFARSPICSGVVPQQPPAI